LELIHKKLQGRAICLEQIIFKLIETQGFDWVLERVLPNLDCDKALKSAFGSGSNSQSGTVLDSTLIEGSVFALWGEDDDTETVCAAPQVSSLG
jgi:hypothetical protein